MLTTDDIIVRLLVAIALGAVLGLERTFAGKPAGMRTYAMAAIGACSFIIADLLASTSIFNVPGSNPIVIEQAVISGIGFIGAGLVIFQNNKVLGVTTAAGLWVAAAIGIASGFGYFTLAILSTGAAMLVFTVLKFIENALDRRFAYKGLDTEKEESGK